MHGMVRELQKGLIYKQSCRVVANFLLNFTNFCYHDNKGRRAVTWITLKVIDLQNTQFGAKIWDLSYIWEDLL